MDNLDLSVIILSFNTKDITDECLIRLQVAVDRCQKKMGNHGSSNKIEVIVLDNDSKDGSVDMIESKHKWVKLIKSKVNTGYSKGNNIAFKKTKTKYILFLNSDVFLEQDTLVKALEYFGDHDNCDVLGPKLVYGNGKFQPSAGNLPNPFNTICWILGISLIPIVREFTYPFHPNYSGFFRKEKQVGWVTGAFFMIKKEVYKRVGGFDENIFMYTDEVDFCKRITNLGYKVWYVPNILVTHLHGASSKSDPSFAITSELKGLRVYFKKYYLGAYPLVKFSMTLGLILRVIAFSFLGKTNRARAYVEGLGVI